MNRRLGQHFTAAAHYVVEPNQYERELAQAVGPMLAEQRPDELADTLAHMLSSHRSRVASLYLAVLPSGDEPYAELRAALKLARDVVGNACHMIGDDPRGQLIARLRREKFEAEAELARLQRERP